MDNISHDTVIGRVQQNLLWQDMCKVAQSNNALQKAIEQCIIIYKLSEEYKNGI
jgi:hypothetical protein